MVAGWQNSRTMHDIAVVFVGFRLVRRKINLFLFLVVYIYSWRILLYVYYKYLDFFLQMALSKNQSNNSFLNVHFKNTYTYNENKEETCKKYCHVLATVRTICNIKYPVKSLCVTLQHCYSFYMSFIEKRNFLFCLLSRYHSVKIVLLYLSYLLHLIKLST